MSVVIVCLSGAIVCLSGAIVCMSVVIVCLSGAIVCLGGAIVCLSCAIVGGVVGELLEEKQFLSDKGATVAILMRGIQLPGLQRKDPGIVTHS